MTEPERAAEVDEAGDEAAGDAPISRVGIVAASVIILVTLALQSLTAFTITFGPLQRPPYLWPFLDYPMYQEARYAGEPIERQVVVGILADSSEVVITPAALNVGFWQLQNDLNPAIRSGDLSTANAYRELYENRHEQRLVGFRLENRPFVLTDEGLTDGSPTVLGTLYFESDRGLH